MNSDAIGMNLWHQTMACAIWDVPYWPGTSQTTKEEANPMTSRAAGPVARTWGLRQGRKEPCQLTRE